MFPDADSLLFTVFTLVLMVISLLFTILLIRSKPSTMKRLPKKRTVKTKQETKIVKTTKVPEISNRAEALERTRVAPPVRGCPYYLGYLEKLSTSSFPYGCLACPQINKCIGEKQKKPEKVASDLSEYSSDMNEYRIATRIKTTIEKATNAPWKDLRGNNEQAVPGDQVPELYELLKELGGKIKHNDWEYQCYEKPLNIVVRIKHKTRA